MSEVRSQMSEAAKRHLKTEKQKGTKKLGNKSRKKEKGDWGQSPLPGLCFSAEGNVVVEVE